MHVILSFYLSHIQNHPHENTSILSVNWLTASFPQLPQSCEGTVSCQFQITACCCWRKEPIVFICCDSWLEAAGGIDLSMCLVSLWSGICPDTAPLATVTLVHLHSVFTYSFFLTLPLLLCSPPPPSFVAVDVRFYRICWLRATSVCGCQLVLHSHFLTLICTYWALTTALIWSELYRGVTESPFLLPACVCQLFVLVSNILYIFSDVLLCRSAYPLPLFHLASSWAAVEKKPAAFTELRLALRSDPTFNFHSRGCSCNQSLPQRQTRRTSWGLPDNFASVFVSTICGEVFRKVCCTSLQYEPEVVLWLCSIFKSASGQETWILYWGWARVNREEAPLFVNPKVCLFFADSVSARRLFTLSLRHLMYVALLLVRRCVDIWPECFCNQFFSSRCLWAGAV